MRASVSIALLLAVAALGACARPAERTNLVLVTIDTLRRDHLGVYGDRAAATPTLDALAAAGARFTAATSNAPLTLVSHASLLSGLLPPHHGLRNNGAGAFPADRATLATTLAAAGYRTGAFVGAFVLDRRFGLSRGFETFDDEIERPVGERPALEAERPADRVVDRALAWLDGRADRDRRPFFLWVHLYDPHAPYAPPSPYAERFARDPYRGEIAFVDAQLARLLDALARSGRDADTVVAVAADHGEGLGEHGESTHGMLLYESTLAVPLLLRAPGLAPRTVATPVGLVDLAPTLAGLVGHPFAAGETLDGRDLSAPLLAGREPTAAEVYAETRYPEIFGWSPLSALRRRDLKFIAAPHPELYDLAADPGEARDLARTASFAAQSRGFGDRLAAIEASAVAAPAAPVDAETARQLASLGYVAGGAPTRSAGGKEARPNPKDRIALFERFEAAYAELRAGRAKNLESSERVLDELRALAAHDPGNATFRSRLAQALRESGHPDAALPVLASAAAAAPSDPDVWYDLAVALSGAGRRREARAAIDRAVRLDSSRPDALNLLGLLRLEGGEIEAARQEFERAVAVDPRHAAALNNLGNALRALDRPGEAEGAYRRAIAAAPRYGEPWNGLGTLLVAVDRPREAIEAFDRALALAPGNLEARLNRGIALDLAGDRAAAAAAYREFIAAAGASPQWAAQRQAAAALLARATAR